MVYHLQRLTNQSVMTKTKCRNGLIKNQKTKGTRSYLGGQPGFPHNKSLNKGLAMLSIITFQEPSFKAKGNTIIHIIVHSDANKPKYI